MPRYPIILTTNLLERDSVVRAMYACGYARDGLAAGADRNVQTLSRYDWPLMWLACVPAAYGVFIYLDYKPGEIKIDAHSGANGGNRWTYTPVNSVRHLTDYLTINHLIRASKPISGEASPATIRAGEGYVVGDRSIPYPTSTIRLT